MQLLNTLFVILAITHMGLGNQWSRTETGDYESLIPESEQPKIMTTNQVFKLIGQDNVTLPCEIDRIGEFNVVWKRKNSIIIVYKGHMAGYYVQHVMKDPRIHTVNTSLVLLNVTAEDEGTYTCEISDSYQMIQHEVYVYVAPTAKATGGITLMEEKIGSSVTLSCDVDGNPPPKIYWYKKGFPDDILSNKSKLSLQRVATTDNGIYACLASNGHGKDVEAQIALQIQYAPHVLPQTKPTHTGVDEQAMLQCTIDAKPTAKVYWLKNGTEVDFKRLRKGIKKNNRYILSFPRVVQSDFGYYSCYAINPWGNSSGIVRLTGRPASPTIISPRMFNNSDEYLLRWETLSYSPIISYKLAVNNSTGDEWLSVTIPGLKSRSMYHSQKFSLGNLGNQTHINVKIQARNEIGTSPWSKSITITNSDHNTMVELDYTSDINVEDLNVGDILEEFMDTLPTQKETNELLMHNLTDIHLSSASCFLVSYAIFFSIILVQIFHGWYHRR